MENPADSAQDARARVEAFLDRAEQAMGDAEAAGRGPLARPGAPEYRRLRVRVSSDGLEAVAEALFPGTTWEEVQDALVQARIAWGVDEGHIRAALEKAGQTGRLQRQVCLAKGKPAGYQSLQEVHYPFLEGRKMPETGEPLHLASSVFRDILEVMHYPDVEHVRAYALPVVAVAPGTVLMRVQGRLEVIPGRDVFGQEIKTVMANGPEILKPGEGVTVLPDERLVAERYGYVAVQNRSLRVLSPVWISSNSMEAYFFNPPGLGDRPAPNVATVLGLLQDEGIRFGVDEGAIASMCKDLRAGALRESCVRIARGRPPSMSKGQVRFHFEPLPPLRFERVQHLLQTIDVPDASACEDVVTAVSVGAVLGEQVAEGDAEGPGRDLFDRPVSPPEGEKRRIYKAGPNVVREVRDGRAFFVAKIYGYAGVLDDAITVLSPLWMTPDRMAVHFVALPQDRKPMWPSESELRGLLEQARVRFGVKEDVIKTFDASVGTAPGIIAVAEGAPAKPGVDGTVALQFKKLPDPGQLLDGGKIDFRERDGVPQAHSGELLAVRTFPKPGESGRDVRGRLMPPPKSRRELLYAGPHVIMEERGGAQLFYATGNGWARVVKDTLSVQQRFRHRGNVDYQVGNLKMEGDIEIDGSVKSRFRVEATGDVYITGAVERRAQIVAGGNVVVKRGIVGAEIRTKGNLYARFVQESELHIEGDLLVRNSIQDSQVKVVGQAMIQGNEGGSRQLCLLGGVLFAGKGIEGATLGSAYGRPTRVITGVDVDAEKQIERYRKGIAFCDLQMRRAMRGIAQLNKADLAGQLQHMSPNQREFAMKRLKDLSDLRTLHASLEHYIVELKKECEKTAATAQVRVLVSAFPKVAIQIGGLHRILETELGGKVFRLNGARNAIVDAPLD